MPTMTAEQVERALPTMARRFEQAPDAVPLDVQIEYLANELTNALLELDAYERADHAIDHTIASDRVRTYWGKTRGVRLNRRVREAAIALDAALARREGDGDGN